MEVMMSTEPSRHHVDVPGASVYYEVRGSGPLLLVVGQPMTSGPFCRLADLLADDHTVVTYDPHGVGKSTVEDPSLAVTPEIEADDLAQIIDDIGAERADVFGSSGGAVAGLGFAVRHPDKLGTLIAHEPPLPELLPDAPYVRAAIDDVENAYRTDGPGAGFGKFVSLVMHDGPVTGAGVSPAAWPPPGSGDGEAATDGSESSDGGEAPPVPTEKEQADNELFLLQMLKPFLRYQPPVDVLRSAGPRIVVAVGAASQEDIAARSTRALAERLGTPAVVFPGDHGGFMADPEGFAMAIRTVLTDSP
jgi:pimeloyl-ACP methyl ester carboxylesterase